MKKIFTIILLTFSMISFGQGLSFEDWEKESQQNKRLLPKYGAIQKTEMEKKYDQDFIAETMKAFSSQEDASNHMVDLGFKYLYQGDLKTAMYRFNQAYLLDQKNSNIYWGYGAVYMAFGKFDLSRNQYQEGLKINPKNDHLWIDYGTTYLGEFYEDFETDSVKADVHLDEAIEKLQTAYSINPDNSNSSYKLSICYLHKDNCEEAKKYLEISEELLNPNITESYKAELEEHCATSNIDCSGIKTGKFKIDDEKMGETIILRTENYQIEENKKYGYKLKLEVTWLDDCTYMLKPVEDMLNPDNKNLPKMLLTCKITEITDTGYVQISSSNLDPTKMRIELTTIE